MSEYEGISEMTDKHMMLPELVSEYKDLTLQIVEINKRRYVLANELNDLGIKVPALGRLCPDGIS